jgi:hypothetical protein
MNRLKGILRNLHLLLTRELWEVFESQEQKLNQRADSYEQALDTRLDERFSTIEQRLDERQDAQEQQANERASNYEASLDARFEERFAILEQRNDEQFAAFRQLNDERQAALDQRFDDRARAVDNRLDDRFARIERQLDERFELLEKRTDARMETHEKRTDYNLKLNRADILDRTDVMLQIFEQRLDQQRREIKALREQFAQTPAVVNREAKHEGNGSHATPIAVEPQQILAETQPAQQVQSFRKLAQSSGLIGKTRLPVTAATLYQKILDWKKVAAEKLTEFTPDEQEVVNYILSFIHDADERDYTMHHLRRFVATLQRIPPPQRSTDRLLELGSLLHLAPAIKKFCGLSGSLWCRFLGKRREGLAGEAQTSQWEREPHLRATKLQRRIRSLPLPRRPFPRGALLRIAGTPATRPTAHALGMQSRSDG